MVCFLEVLAPYRPDPALQTGLDAIESNDEDGDTYATVAPGRLDRSWCDNRLFCTARLTGDFALPSHHETLPILREKFLVKARKLGVDDVDAAAVRMSAPRELTQSISAWLYEIVGPDGERINGVQYVSRDSYTGATKSTVLTGAESRTRRPNLVLRFRHRWEQFWEPNPAKRPKPAATTHGSHYDRDP